MTLHPTDPLTATYTPTATATQTPSPTPTPTSGSSYTVALLHMNGTDGATAFTDESGKTWTRHGNAQLDTAQKKFGTASLLLDGIGDYLSTPHTTDLNLGTNNFTVDFWVRFNSVSTEQVFVSKADDNNGWYLFYDGTNHNLEFDAFAGGVGVLGLQYSWSPSTGQWYHVAFVRSGNNWQAFVNGALLGTDTASVTVTNTTFDLNVGAYPGGVWTLNGWIDEFRLSNGVARWTSNFTPPTSEYSSLGKAPQNHFVNYRLPIPQQQSGTDADTIGVFRPSNFTWYLKNANDATGADISVSYGVAGDYPVVGDWDGNGTSTIGIYRNGTFYLSNSNASADIVFAFGAPGDQPVAGDWDGDGVDTIGVYHSATGTFLLGTSNTATTAVLDFPLGTSGDIAVVGDWNGDGTDTIGVYRPGSSTGTFYLRNVNDPGYGDLEFAYGLSSDQPLAGDWNNDGMDTIGLFRPSEAKFYLRNSNSTGNADLAFAFGVSTDVPVAGNWDGVPPAPTPTNTPVTTATPTVPVGPTPTNPPTPTPRPAGTFSNASFSYDGDGKRVKSVMITDLGTTTTYFVGAHYEVANPDTPQETITKYYYAGTQRIAMRSNGTLYFTLGDHLGSTSLTTFANGNVVSELRYTAWGEVRSPADGRNPGPSDYTYTGQYSDSYINLLWYGSRHYDPELGRFTSPDSIVPTSVQGVQALDRYAYANNAPTRYTDPTGHMAWEGDGGDLKKEDAEYYRQRNDYLKCQSGNSAYCSTFDLIIRHPPKPVSGIHIGYSGQAGFVGEKGIYDQWDFLIDWKEGNLYIVQTAGTFTYVGTPTGLIGEVYAGTSNVHGVPGDVEDISDWLAGPQVDASLELGLDGIGELGGVKGVSIDLDPATGDPYYSPGAGFMYTTENSVEFGLNEIPNAFEGGVQFGYSESFTMGIIPLWP